MKLEERIAKMLKKHTHLQHNDNLLVANVYSELYQNRYAFNQFLYHLADGKVPSQNLIINIKNKLTNG
jgi:hypothetical protein